MNDQFCATCAYAAFERTATGRIKKAIPGRCGAPLPDLAELKIPSCTVVPTLRKNAVWPDMGSDCPLWMEVKL